MSVNLARHSVLLVDDEPQVLIALEDLLSDEFTVYKAANPQAALKLVENERDIAGEPVADLVARSSQLHATTVGLAGALAMMAGWDLAPLNRALPLIRAPVLLLHGERDRIVPVRQSDEVAARLAQARVERLPTLGHLAHEERPRHVANALASWFEADG